VEGERVRATSFLPTQNRVRWAGWAAVVAALLTVGLMTYGGWVRASGSGLGCPDWPLCQGDVLPEFQGATAIEFGHRMFAGVTMLTVALAALLAFRARSMAPAVYRLLVGSLALILVQAGLGGVTVLTELHGMAVVAHLILAMITLALLTAAAIWALCPPGGVGLGIGLTSASVVLAAVVIVLGGSLVGTGLSAACPGVPLCDERTVSWRPSLLHGAHRLATGFLMVLLVMVAVQLRRNRGTRMLKALYHGVLLLMAAQIVVGLVSVLQILPTGLRVLHLGLATGLWWAITASWTLAFIGRRT